jgi:glycerophosphoryl diester phosphodiesterase
MSRNETPAAPLIIGHRGAAAVAPENTLISFERALTDGADGIEFDVRLAEDNVPVVIHDSTLRRTALRHGRIANLSSSELMETDVGSWFNQRRPRLARASFALARIPTLSNVFAMLQEASAILYVEMKCGLKDRTPLAREVVKLINHFSLKPRAIVESFDLASIAEVKRLDSDIRTAALFDRRITRPVPLARSLIERAIKCGAEEIALHRSLATRRRVEEAHRRGLETVVWTADNSLWVERAIKFGIRAIITNNPARLCARREEILSDKR